MSSLMDTKCPMVTRGSKYPRMPKYNSKYFIQKPKRAFPKKLTIVCRLRPKKRLVLTGPKPKSAIAKAAGAPPSEVLAISHVQLEKLRKQFTDLLVKNSDETGYEEGYEISQDAEVEMIRLYITFLELALDIARLEERLRSAGVLLTSDNANAQFRRKVKDVKDSVNLAAEAVIDLDKSVGAGEAEWTERSSKCVGLLSELVDLRWFQIAYN